MTVLAVETATAAVGAALADDSGVLASVTVAAGRRHAETLHPAIGQVLELAGVELGALSGVAADVGPGLFTGIRVGVATAKGLALGLGIPVVGRTSLEILAAAVEAAGGLPLPVVDLRRGEVAWQLPGADPEHGPPERLAALVVGAAESAAASGRLLVLAGDGARRYAGQLAGGGSAAGRVEVAGAVLSTPPVASLAVTAVDDLAAGRGTDAAGLEPVYLRGADTRINWSTRHDAPGRAAGGG